MASASNVRAAYLAGEAWRQCLANRATTGSVVAAVATSTALMFILLCVLSGVRAYVANDIVGRLIGAYTFQIRQQSPYLADLSTDDPLERRWGPPVQNAEAQAVVDELAGDNRWALLIPQTGWQVRAPDGGLVALTANLVFGDYFQIRGITASEGRLLTPRELELGTSVVVLGSRSAELLFPRGNSVGQYVRLGGQRFNVVGVAAAQGSILGSTQDETVFASLRSPARLLTNRRATISVVLIQCSTRQAMEVAIDRARAVLRTRRRLRPNDKDDFAIVTGDAITRVWDRVQSKLALLVVALPLITIAVSGLVLANLMLISVVDRIPEIGIRRAVGASARDVRLQFLVEAVGLSLFGATLGQVIGVVAVTTLGIFTPIPARVPLTPFMLVSALAILLGMIVGWLPARYAYRLSPIDALGRER